MDRLRIFVLSFLMSATAALGLIAGVLTVIVGGTMTIIGVYVVYTVNDSIGYSDATTISIYDKIMKAFTILGVAMIVIGAGVILKSLFELQG